MTTTFKIGDTVRRINCPNGYEILIDKISETCIYGFVTRSGGLPSSTRKFDVGQRAGAYPRDFEWVTSTPSEKLTSKERADRIRADVEALKKDGFNVTVGGGKTSITRTITTTEAI